MRVHEPQELYTAIKLARLQEHLMRDILEAVKPKPTLKQPYNPKPWPNTPPPIRLNQPNLARNPKPKHLEPRALNSQPNTKRTPGACWKCGDRNFPGHQLKKLMALALEGKEIEEAKPEDRYQVGEDQETQGIVDDEQLQLSINALDGGLADTAIKLRGTLNKKSILILIDSGSTHSFIDVKVAREPRVPLVAIRPIPVAVDDERKLTVTQKCIDCGWTMQGNQFDFTLRVLGLGTMM